MIQLMNLLTMSWDVSKSSSRILFLITSLTKSKDILNTGCRTWKNIICRSKCHSSEVMLILHFPRWWVFHYCQLEEHTRQEKWAWGRNSQGKERGTLGPGTTPSGISGREPASSGGWTDHYWDLYRVMTHDHHHHHTELGLDCVIRGQDEAEDELDNEVGPGHSLATIHNIHSEVRGVWGKPARDRNLDQNDIEDLWSGNVTGTFWSLKVVFARLASGRPWPRQWQWPPGLTRSLWHNEAQLVSVASASQQLFILYNKHCEILVSCSDNILHAFWNILHGF